MSIIFNSHNSLGNNILTMKYSSVLLICIFLFTFHHGEAQDCPTDEKIVACYYASWSYNRVNLGKFNIDHIDPLLCTHVIYTFSGLDINSKIVSLDPGHDFSNDGFSKFSSLKTINPCVKLILAIGGWNEGSRKYSVMASTQESRIAFVDSVLRFIVHYNFDGFDFDWEYPAHRGGISSDRDNFTELLKLLKERLSKWGLSLSVAVPFSTEAVDAAYDIVAIKDYVDFVSIMAYDYTPVDSPVTGLITPMSSVVKSIEHWINKGFPVNKLLLGLASYTRTFRLEDANDHEIGSPTNGTGIAGIYTQENGFLSYYELQAKLRSLKYKEVEYDGNFYAYSKLEWMTYDTIETYKAKINYALGKNLKGLMLWTLDTDDFLGRYGKPYIILETINEAIRGSK